MQDTDNGQQATNLLNSIDIKKAINRLTNQDKKIITLLSKGYTKKEVTKQLKTTNHQIKKAQQNLKQLIN